MILPNDLSLWLKTEPAESEIAIINDYAQVIPIHIVKKHLDYLTQMGHWETKNFKVNYITINGNEAIDASLELVINIFIAEEIEYSRTLTGACTYTLQYIREIDNITGRYGVSNEHYSATALSLCIVNAAKNLGAKFGANLNIVAPKLEEGFTEKPIQVNEFSERELMKEAIRNATSFNSLKGAVTYLLTTEFKHNQEVIDAIENYFKVKKK